MVEYQIVYYKKCLKDIEKLKASKLDEKAKGLIDMLRKNPYKNPPPFEKLVGDLKGAYSRRINHQHRLVYQVIDDQKIVRIISMWSHYG
ncbi:MAG: Txe/YoeB family addiction module toxin [Clostridia bacterium]|jgi:Txe/YoeB family toxin of toxin-antitoxin system|nr:Txe/YoeB family addiction module toxin [Clostridia bacterium]HPD90417.1 Txe/YoeB family addiction module toxin [Bacillota bacterium]